MWILAAAVSAFGLLVAAPQESERQASAVPTVEPVAIPAVEKPEFERGFLSEVEVWSRDGYASTMGFHVGRKGERIPFIRMGDIVVIPDAHVRWSELPTVGPGSDEGFGAFYRDRWVYTPDIDRNTYWVLDNETGKYFPYSPFWSREHHRYDPQYSCKPAAWLVLGGPGDSETTRELGYLELLDRTPGQSYGYGWYSTAHTQSYCGKTPGTARACSHEPARGFPNVRMFPLSRS